MFFGEKKSFSEQLWIFELIFFMYEDDGLHLSIENNLRTLEILVSFSHILHYKKTCGADHAIVIRTEQ